jgi:DNA-binding NtrC family response regulator
VLIISDTAATTASLLKVLAARKLRGLVAESVADAHRRFSDASWELAAVDVRLLGEGFALLEELRRDQPELFVIAVGPEDSARKAVDALRGGCDEFLSCPVDGRQFGELLDTLLPQHQVSLMAAAAEDTRCLYRIAGRSGSLEDVLSLASRIAPTSVPVLITGESGTGKELISYHVHRQSLRSRGPYIRVNCAALNESLLESELFGHERGAFTGAHTRREGRFERAHGGTLLLDEISETGPRLQAELLRVLEQQDFERVGGSEMVHVNVRVISTSNVDLTAAVERGEFRRDLYYRLCGVHLHVPPLRHRVEDIPLLVWHFVNQYACEARREINKLDDQMLELFRTHDWPGNVRQLRNVVRQALLMGRGPVLSLDDAPALQRELIAAGCDSVPTLALQELERQAILEALRRTDSHQAKAASLLGITDRTLREKMRRYREEGLLETQGDRQWQSQPA